MAASPPARPAPQRSATAKAAGLGLLALAAVAGGACTAPPEHRAPPSEHAAWIFLDADSRGAVLLRATGGAPDILRGVDRFGTRVWERNDLAAAQPAVVCVRQCPDAVASSGTVSGIDVPATPLGKADVAAASLTPGSALLSATGDAVVQEIRSTGGQVTLLSTSGFTRRQVEVDGTRTTWRASNDNRAAIALVADTEGSGYTVRTFHRETAWEPTDWTAQSRTLFGCANAGGHQVVVSDPVPTLIDLRDGRRVAIPGLESGGDCAFTEHATVVAQYGLTESGYRTHLVTTGLDGEVLWRQKYDDEARIRADLGGSNFLVLLANTAYEHDSRGVLLQTVQDVADARYDENGDIVLVTTSGVTRWKPGSGRA
ncbi:hypothetical protein [Amycolatopsis magusensis]|uniref:hypothetical protein n=1 Tax=Amycolatopsis magusensis TaxID=882444 RepID=UPI003C2D9591